MYQRLGVTFDHTLGESFYDDRLAAIVDELLGRGIARESDGAVCVFLDGIETPMIVRKKDGAFLYGTTDLATIRYRMETWQPDAILYVVDHRQALHFKQLFAAARLLGYDDVELQHVSFGTVLGDDGRPFKTRSGDTVGLEGLLGRGRAPCTRNRFGQRRRQARRTRAFRIDSGQQIAETRRHRRTEIRRPLAKPHERLRLQLRQDAGHVRQHGHVHAVCLRPGAEHLLERQRRCRRAASRPARRSCSTRRPSGRWAVELLRFAEALDMAAADYRPNQLTSYLFDLANRYSTFFEQCHVLRAASEDLRQSRLLLCDLTARTIQKGLELLGIEVVEKM